MIYEEALELAEKFLLLLRPVCKRIEIVGSVKREKTEVHDIELLLIPNDGYPMPEFGRPKNLYKSHLEKQLADLEHDNWIQQAADKKDGDKYKKRAIVGTGQLNEFCLDLFIVNERTWGIQNLIRTGNSWFSHRCVTNKQILAVNREDGRRMPGFLPNDLRYIKGKDMPNGESCIKRGDEILSLPEEQDVFELIFGKWIPPNERTDYADRR